MALKQDIKRLDEYLSEHSKAVSGDSLQCFSYSCNNDKELGQIIARAYKK